MELHTFSPTLSFKLKSKKTVANWLSGVFVTEGVDKDVSLNVVFCSDQELLDMNKQFLEHDYYTDIITFPIEESDTHLEAELYISIDRVKDNAKRGYYSELLRVLVHGVLHLCGYKDKSPEEEALMRSKENEYLLMMK